VIQKNTNEITSTSTSTSKLALCPANKKCCVKMDAKCTASSGKCQAGKCDEANYNLVIGKGLCPDTGKITCCVKKEHGCAASYGTCEDKCDAATTDELAGTGLCPTVGKTKCCKKKNPKCTAKGGTCHTSCQGKVDQGAGLCTGTLKCCK